MREPTARFAWRASGIGTGPTRFGRIACAPGSIVTAPAFAARPVSASSRSTSPRVQNFMKWGGRRRSGFSRSSRFVGLRAFGKETSKTKSPPGFSVRAISATARGTKLLPMCRKTALVEREVDAVVLERQRVGGGADRVEAALGRGRELVAVLDEALQHRLGDVDGAVGRPGHVALAREVERDPPVARADLEHRAEVALPRGNRSQTGAILPVSVP